MKQPLILLAFLLLATTSFSQNRYVTRGATPGELYFYGQWYGTYAGGGYDTLYWAVYRLTENGKKLTMQYHLDYFTNPHFAMNPDWILADAAPGALYAISSYSKNNYTHTALWASLDHGENWMFREECRGSIDYFSANSEGLIYKTASLGACIGTYRSYDYAETFTMIFNGKINAKESGFEECEFFTLNTREFYHTFDCFQNYTHLAIDEEFVHGIFEGMQPDVYRGALPGEVYVRSWFPDWTYKVSFSADTGRTFRHVYVYEDDNDHFSSTPFFMSDREPGVFYLLRTHRVLDYNPWGAHQKICVHYYRDYGEILEAVFCHDVHKNYVYEEVVCDNTVHLASHLQDNSVQLTWSSSAESEQIRGYHVFRNDVRITNQMLTETTYLDENLPDGNYEYYVRTYYVEGCASDASNSVEESIGVGIGQVSKLEGIAVYPNPTTGELTIENGELKIENVDILDVLGRKQKIIFNFQFSTFNSIDISHLSAGVYFVRITTEAGVAMRKVVKQ